MNTALYSILFLPAIFAGGDKHNEFQYVAPGETQIYHEIKILRNEQRRIAYINEVKNKHGRITAYWLAEIDCGQKTHRYLGKGPTHRAAMQAYDESQPLVPILPNTLEAYQRNVACAHEKLVYEEPDRPGIYHQIKILREENKKVAYIDKVPGNLFGQGRYYRLSEVDCQEGQHRYLGEGASYKKAMTRFTENVALTTIAPNSLAAAQFKVVCSGDANFETESEFEKP